MIRPHKYLDINSSIIGVGAEVLKILMTDQVVRIPELESKIKKRKGERSLEMLQPSLCLLFTINKIKYHKEIDSIEYLV